jgi:hypothetical protein
MNYKLQTPLYNYRGFKKDLDNPVEPTKYPDVKPFGTDPEVPHLSRKFVTEMGRGGNNPANDARPTGVRYSRTGSLMERKFREMTDEMTEMMVDVWDCLDKGESEEEIIVMLVDLYSKSPEEARSIVLEADHRVGPMDEEFDTQYEADAANAEWDDLSDDDQSVWLEESKSKRLSEIVIPQIETRIDEIENELDNPDLDEAQITELLDELESLISDLDATEEALKKMPESIRESGEEIQNVAFRAAQDGMPEAEIVQMLMTRGVDESKAEVYASDAIDRIDLKETIEVNPDDPELVGESLMETIFREADTKVNYAKKQFNNGFENDVVVGMVIEKFGCSRSVAEKAVKKAFEELK